MNGTAETAGPLEPPPLALYVHLPWCVRKCPYCDFNSHPLSGDLPEEQYLEALLDDLAFEVPFARDRSIVSVFLGGGTPSLFSARSIGRLLDAVSAQLRCAAQVEVTLEANPGTVERGRFASYRCAGVNRLSVGVQSFNSNSLSALGRIHDADEARAALDECAAAGIDNANVDLMFGLPGQTVAQALDDVHTAISFAPAHVSCYQLTLEPGTVFQRYPPALPDDELCWEMQQRGAEMLAAAGYEHYEVSAYARSGRRCLHNLNYWRYGDFIGIGAGAHGKLTSAGRITRSWRVRSPRTYMSAAHPRDRVAGTREVSPREAVFEFMLNTLRLAEGFQVSALETRTVTSFDLVRPELLAAEAEGLVERTAGGWRASELGARFLNDLQGRFLPD